MPDLDSKELAQAIYQESKIFSPLRGREYEAASNALNNIALHMCMKLHGTDTRQRFMSICRTGKPE